MGSTPGIWSSEKMLERGKEKQRKLWPFALGSYVVMIALYYLGAEFGYSLGLTIAICIAALISVFLTGVGVYRGGWPGGGREVVQVAQPGPAATGGQQFKALRPAKGPAPGH